MKMESICSEHTLLVSLFILGYSCTSNKGGLYAKWTILLSITTKKWGLEMVWTLQHAFLGSLCSLVELLKVHIWPSMQNLWPSFAEGLGHYNTFWVLWLVNKMTNVFSNYNCNYMVMLMTIISGGRPEGSKCNLKF